MTLPFSHFEGVIFDSSVHIQFIAIPLQSLLIPLFVLQPATNIKEGPYLRKPIQLQ